LNAAFAMAILDLLSTAFLLKVSSRFSGLTAGVSVAADLRMNKRSKGEVNIVLDTQAYREVEVQLHP
jgi:hypothetical protein